MEDPTTNNIVCGGGSGGSGIGIEDLTNSMPSLSLSNVIQQQNQVIDNENKILNTELLTMSTQTVISFVYCNRQPSLFNLLTQMLTTNTFTPINPTIEIPFQPSPYPSTIHASSSTSTSSSSSSSSATSSPTLSSVSTNNNHKSSLMFNILDSAINAVSQQYKKNFYIHILEKTTSSPLIQPINSASTTPTTPSDHDLLVAGCLSFINHMLSAAPSYFDFERYRQVLSSQGVNEIIKTYVKSVSPCVRLELLHYQKHKINGIKAAKQTSVNQDKQNIMSFINRLCKMSFPMSGGGGTGDINGTIRTSSSTEDKMKLLGFETEDLNQELQSTGLLGIRNMIYFCARYYRIYSEILQAQIKKSVSTTEIPEQGSTQQLHQQLDESSYSFSRVGFTLTNLIYELYIEDENLYEIIFDQDDWFEELFCISFELFDEIWEREGNCQEDYITVLHKTRAVLSRLKWTNPPSIQSFQKTLGNVLDEMWSKTKDIKEEKEMSARAGGLSDSIIGIPHGNGGNGSNDPNSRFKKFFGEKFKNYRRSTDSYGSDGVIGNDTSTLSSNSAPGGDSEAGNKSPTSTSHQHKINTKSGSIKKLKSILVFENERKLSGGSASLTVLVGNDNVGDNVSGGHNGTGDRSSLSLPNTPRYMGAGENNNEEGSENGGSSSSFSFAEKLSKKLRSGSIRDKSSNQPKYNVSGELIIGGGTESSSTSTNVSPALQPISSMDGEHDKPQPFNIDDGKRSLRSSGSSIYKSVKKAMVNLEKKVKGNKPTDGNSTTEKKKKKKKSHHQHNYQEDDDTNFNNSNNQSNVSPYIIPGDLELPTDFRPSLDLDFDKNSDSSYEDSSENETNTLDDIQSMDSNMNNSSSNIKLSLSQSQIINLMNDPQTQPDQPIVKQQEQEQQQSSNEPTPIISSTIVNNDQMKIPIVVIDHHQNDQNNNIDNSNSGINRSISDQSLTDAATLNYQLSVQNQNQKQQQQKRLSAEESKSDNSSNDQPISPSTTRRQHFNKPTGGSFGKQSTISSQQSSSSLTKKPVLSRAPIPTTFSSTPPVLVKSPSIKSLVSFFEVKSFELTPAPQSTGIPTLQKEKSFKSDS